MDRIELPAGPAAILAGLAAGGYTAYVVGGCVRDALLGRAPHDWDICTCARPEQAAACFPGLRVLPTGIRHGTVTVLLEGAPYEVTTYRVDGAYSDGRHPDQVSFVDQLPLDLARRDFTINAMAAGPDGKIVDLYGGRADLAAGLVRCVGDPDVRFGEDALRMLRAARFAARYGFAVEEATARSIHRRRALLGRVAAERIRVELEGLLTGPGVENVLLEFADLLAVFWPQLAPMAGFDQRSPWHPLDLWGHTARAVACAPPDRLVRLALLLHDVGKPAAFTVGPDGRGHFPGHARRGAAMAGEMLRRLRFDNAAVEGVTRLIACHDAPLGEDAPGLLRWLARLGPEGLEALFQVKRADCLAQDPALAAPVLAGLERARRAAEGLMAGGACWRVDQLAVGGRDLMALGVPQGPRVGALLAALLEQVMDGRTENSRAALLGAARRLASDMLPEPAQQPLLPHVPPAQAGGEEEDTGGPHGHHGP